MPTRSLGEDHSANRRLRHSAVRDDSIAEENVSKLMIIASHALELNQILYETFIRTADIPIADHRELMFIVYNLILHGRNDRSISISALSRHCGISRETLRRKISTLVDIGYVIRSESGVRMSPGMFSDKITKDALKRIARNIHYAAQQLSEGTAG